MQIAYKDAIQWIAFTFRDASGDEHAAQDGAIDLAASLFVYPRTKVFADVHSRREQIENDDQ